MMLEKYSASGNDFLIFHTLNKFNFSSFAKKLCARSYIGADGLVVLLPSRYYAYEWAFYNSDGSAANMCGNASRCVAHYALNNKLAKRKHIFLSGAGPIEVEVTRDIVEVNFGRVKIVRENILDLGMEFTLLDSGVPHLVCFSDRTPDIKLMQNLRKKYNANVTFANIKNRKSISLFTYERGVEGITKSCGTGAACVFFLAFSKNKIDNHASLVPPIGEKLEFWAANENVYYKGRVLKIASLVI